MVSIKFEMRNIYTPITERNKKIRYITMYRENLIPIKINNSIKIWKFSMRTINIFLAISNIVEKSLLVVFD